MKLAFLLSSILSTSVVGFLPSSLSVASTSRQHNNNVNQERSILTTSLSASDSNDDESSSFVENAITIASSLKSLSGQTIVVKYGGNAMTSPELATLFCQDIATLQRLGLRVVVVHGGGPMINSMLEKVGVESTWEGGMRVSTPEVVDVAAMVLCGTVNKNISGGIVLAGGRALGLSGRDDALLQCEKLMGGDNKDIDIGNVGQVVTVNTDLINELLDNGITPVIAPIGMGCRGADDESTIYNINAGKSICIVCHVNSSVQYDVHVLTKVLSSLFHLRRSCRKDRRRVTSRSCIILNRYCRRARQGYETFRQAKL